MTYGTAHRILEYELVRSKAKKKWCIRLDKAERDHCWLWRLLLTGPPILVCGVIWSLPLLASHYFTSPSEDMYYMRTQLMTEHYPSMLV